MTDEEWVVEPYEKIDLSKVPLPDASQAGIDWRDAAFTKLPQIERKICVPVPCPSFEERTIQVEMCPSCGRADLKWHSSQPFPCDDEFHDLPDLFRRH